MNRAHGQIRRGQVIGTYGPGALIDLPNDSAIVGGLETWSKVSADDEIIEPRLSQKLQTLTEVPAPRLYAPPPESTDPSQPTRGIGVWRFPEWFVVQERDGDEERERSRRLVHRKALDERGRFDGQQVVATRFVRACPKGHVDDLDWRYFVHGPEGNCRRQLWLDERGTGGDLADLTVRCACKKSRPFYEATMLELNPLGPCRGARPWLGQNANEECGVPSRLLTRTASNAYFPQVVSVLSLPDRGSAVVTAVRSLWDLLSIVEDAANLAFLRKMPQVASGLAAFSDEEVLEAIQEIKTGSDGDRAVKEVELEAILAAPEGYGDDVPVDPDFHARKLPESAWLGRPAVKERLDRLLKGHRRWMEQRESERPFPAGPYVLLHSLSHLLIQSLAMRCGYPASSIRERIYAEYDAGNYGVLLYTASPDADGTLGGLVQQARHMEDHLIQALQAGELCSNDPICVGQSTGALLGVFCQGQPRRR